MNLHISLLQKILTRPFVIVKISNVTVKKLLQR